ncbi:uncharacterized protein LOC111483880 [Cucurbita maxima]|uniref:Uncharacterized protein LOC111483880 n=1 Tax=Cucurbita maxima TaxID=3661 RepID=A0A6J1JF96_CUCMA|nr:uncharacterized protein LOC111483880 [Cucurbita maxima]
MSDISASFIDIFPEESENPSESSYDSSNDGDQNGETSSIVKENRAFWKSQTEVLRANLKRTNSIELKIWKATKNALREMNLKSIECGCRRPAEVAVCRECVQREICSYLRNAGFNCAVCKSKWKSSPEIPSGEHSYLEVADDWNPNERVIIEMNFREEFELARASEEYKRLVRRLPEVFIGKAEKLRESIKILCNSAEKCMKEKKMHLGPWRKYRYMQAKWLGKCEKSTPAPLPVGLSDRPPKAKASMLTYDLLQSLPPAIAVEVV